MLIADSTPMIAHGLKAVFSDGSFPGLVAIASCKVDLMDRLQHSQIDVLFLDPAFVQRDLDLGNVDLLYQFRNRFPVVPILLYTAVTNPVVLELLICLERTCIVHKTDDVTDMQRILARLMSGEFSLRSPKTEKILREGSHLRDLMPDVFAP